MGSLPDPVVTQSCIHIHHRESHWEGNAWSAGYNPACPTLIKQQQAVDRRTTEGLIIVSFWWAVLALITCTNWWEIIIIWKLLNFYHLDLFMKEHPIIYDIRRTWQKIPSYPNIWTCNVSGKSTKVSYIFYKLLLDDKHAKGNTNTWLLAIESIFVKTGLEYMWHSHCFNSVHSLKCIVSKRLQDQ